jgi:hypothetical protein
MTLLKMRYSGLFDGTGFPLSTYAKASVDERSQILRSLGVGGRGNASSFFPYIKKLRHDIYLR